jgi:hypothetical protein
MKYNIDSVIKRLERARKAGVGIVEEAELIRIATPKINSIDSIINDIERAIKRTNGECHIVYRKGSRIISRRTLYRWKKESQYPRGRR